MPGGQVNADFWIHEYITPWDFYAHGITSVLAYARTRFQEMYIVETGAYGKALVLDGKWQSCTGDEFLYHEPLVHPPMLLHSDPQRVLILGGGEGATAREVLRHRSVRQCVMIDIDGQVVEACRRHLPDMHQGAFDDPRLELRIEDALAYLERTDARFDVVISDLSDPIEEGPSYALFTRETFEKVRRVLDAGGIFVVQAGPVSPVEMHLHCRLASTLRAVFGHTVSYQSFVPTYAAPWSYILASGRELTVPDDPATIDGLIERRIEGRLRMLDGVGWRGLFSLPRHLREAIAAETHVYTLAEPPKFFGKGIGPDRA